ncbi:class I SAM-dependent methyltransferase [uncultured Sulfitobacter sp.]|uniref:class I SAM-dependent methyltransferase n=1 Tax=Sulfitobacter sp. SH22 TaxID=3421172 RepID=UPI0025D6D382|nr:class I SAM-dependent methyltransferase [uncultured Sulfitobacter sp.]
MKKVPAELRVDFVNGPVAHRLRFGGGRGQDIAKAMGLRGGKTPLIVDATAGLGRDSFLLASLGAQVFMIERSEKMHDLLDQGMKRAAQEGGALAEIIGRMTLLKGDAKDLIPELAGEAILIDPMHPPRKSSALVKQELRQVRAIVGSDDDAADLLRVALEHALNRVVLKWPAKADPIAEIKPCTHQICGKSTRYDVFMTATASPQNQPD